MGDSELIQAALRGERRAERALYDAHVDRVYRLCYRLAGSDDDLAQDFTQETFVRAFDRLAGFRGEAAFSTWLHRIAVSVACNGLRRVRKKREREHGFDDVPEIAAPAVRHADPDLKKALVRAVAALPELYRVVFVMYDMEGYTHVEIGAALDLPVGTSKARLSRARAMLRCALAPFAEESVT